MKNILSLLLVPAALALFAAGCTNDIMDRINKNPNDPTDSSADFILPDAIVATATSVVGGDLPLYASVYMELEAGVHNQLWNAETRAAEPTASATYNNAWGSIYINIRNIKDIIDKCDAGTSGGAITKGMAQTLLAINVGTLTNYFGDIPYSQAAEFDEAGKVLYLQPAVDSQKDVYAAIFTLLDEAETNLKSGTGAPTSTSDRLYGGNTALWIKAVNALKARYTLQLLHVSSTATADLDKIIGYVDASFASPAEQMSFSGYDGSETYNPLGTYYFSRLGIAASQSFVDLLDSKNDPRFVIFGIENDPATWIINKGETDEKVADSWTELVTAAPNGKPNQTQDGYSIPRTYFAEWASVHFISYHELMFIKAEALARKNDPAAAEALQAAVSASFDNLNYLSVAGGYTVGFNYLRGPDPTWTWSYKLTKADAQSYFDATVKPAYDANALNEVLIQKYISCTGSNAESTVAYNDYRRMKAMGQDGYLTLKNSNGASKFPLRYTYGTDEVSSNPNVAPLYGNGQYVYTENVWWAGGTR